MGNLRDRRIFDTPDANSSINTNSGLPGNFVAYVAKLTQSGTNPPTADVKVNTLGGTLVWTRDSAGIYTATLAGAFPTESRTVILTGAGNWVAAGVNPTFYFWVGAYWNDANSFSIGTIDILDDTLKDGGLLNTPIEIRIYP
jgi:hypothetical protein